MQPLDEQGGQSAEAKCTASSLRLILRGVHDRRGAGMFADAAPNTILTLARSRDYGSGRPALQGPCRVDGFLKRRKQPAGLELFVNWIRRFI